MTMYCNGDILMASTRSVCCNLALFNVSSRLLFVFSSKTLVLYILPSHKCKYYKIYEHNYNSCFVVASVHFKNFKLKQNRLDFRCALTIISHFVVRKVLCRRFTNLTITARDLRDNEAKTFLFDVHCSYF